MRLAESLRRGILEIFEGGILNRFKIKIKRRDILFFEDILAYYFKECENEKYEEKIKEIGQKWMVLTGNFIPKALKILPPQTFFNSIMKKIWINLGLMDDFYLVKQGGVIKAKTKNEFFTRIIGKNNFTVGCSIGSLNAIFGCEVELINAHQTKKFCEYTLKLKHKLFQIESKKIQEYQNLNSLPKSKDFSLSYALKKRILRLVGNRIYFRGKSILSIENTLFHIIGNYDILLEKVPEISYNYFKDIIELNSSKDQKLLLLKNLLQVMGWGSVKVKINENRIVFNFLNPPFGLQIEKDNWNFLMSTILGYLWHINTNFEIENSEINHKRLKITYSR